MKYDASNPLRCFFAFAGYDSQMMALERLKREYYPKFDYTCVGWSEIDKFVIQAHDVLWPNDKDKNFGDISKIDWANVPDFDLFTYSSPCQDFSQSGLQRGGEEGSGTRSSLLWECRKAIQIKRPMYLLFENVKALVCKTFMPLFQKWLDELTIYGYINYWSVLNAKDFGVPQNRERVFCFSILKEGDELPIFHFPQPFNLEKSIADVVERNPDGSIKRVDDKYYLSDEAFEKYEKSALEK